MLPKIKRLNLSTDFKWVRSGKAAYSPHFQLFGKYGENKLARVGVAITSKFFPKAVMRSKVKRKVFKVFENIYPQLPSSLNIVALPKAGIDKVKSEDLETEVLEVLGKIV